MNRTQALRLAKQRWGKNGHVKRCGDEAAVGWLVRVGVTFFHIAGTGPNYAAAFAEVDRRERLEKRYAEAMREPTPCQRCNRRLTPRTHDAKSSAEWLVGGDGTDQLVCKECKDLQRFGEYLGHHATHYVLALRHAARRDTEPRIRLNQLRRAERLWAHLGGADRGRCVRVLKRLGLHVHDHEFWEGLPLPERRHAT